MPVAPARRHTTARLGARGAASSGGRGGAGPPVGLNSPLAPPVSLSFLLKPAEVRPRRRWRLGGALPLRGRTTPGGDPAHAEWHRHNAPVLAVLGLDAGSRFHGVPVAFAKAGWAADTGRPVKPATSCGQPKTAAVSLLPVKHAQRRLARYFFKDARHGIPAWVGSGSAFVWPDGGNGVGAGDSGAGLCSVGARPNRAIRRHWRPRVMAGQQRGGRQRGQRHHNLQRHVHRASQIAEPGRGDGDRCFHRKPGANVHRRHYAAGDASHRRHLLCRAQRQR